jgi:uncharacterized protein YdiU (UPF0061 family)
MTESFILWVPFRFNNTYATLPENFFSRVQPTKVISPNFLLTNLELGIDLGLSAAELDSYDLLSIFSGNCVPEGATPIALAYAGHQFGVFVPSLGDGRAVLLGEVVTNSGKRLDIQLKGAGRTPYSRNGDGRAAIGPVLREYLVSEALFHLGVPTTRALAAVTTGESVTREQSLTGAILTRVASSHLRVGTFQYLASRRDDRGLRILVDYALNRHFGGPLATEVPALQLLSAVIDAQAKLIAKWQSLGFVHGVMNTDNTSISGETIDYGPCAFLDAFDPSRSFSSIDHAGRYAYSNQPLIGHFNMTRLAEAFLPIVDDSEPRAVELLNERIAAFPEVYRAAFTSEMRRKLGLLSERDDDDKLISALLEQMAKEKVDYTKCFRALCDWCLPAQAVSLPAPFIDTRWFSDWSASWHFRLDQETKSRTNQQSVMLQSNPAIIARNHRVEEAIVAASRGQLALFRRLLDALKTPYDEPVNTPELATPPGPEQWAYRTFCGT